MEFTPEVIESVQFSAAKRLQRGYRKDHVDGFLIAVHRELSELQAGAETVAESGLTADAVRAIAFDIGSPAYVVDEVDAFLDDLIRWLESPDRVVAMRRSSQETAPEWGQEPPSQAQVAPPIEGGPKRWWQVF